jgi:hypothetical protein
MSDDYLCRDLGGGFSVCVERCSGPSDCGTFGAFDGDNYDCVDGACIYLGCNNDEECALSFSSSAYICREVTPPDTGLPIPAATRNCVLACDTFEDCMTPSAAFDDDNYRCEGGACHYEGCNNDEECISSFMSDGYVCR